MFARAPGHRFGRGDFHLLRAETGPFVRSIAKRLALRPAAGAPPILTWFDFLNDGRFLGNDWFAHKDLLAAACARANIFFKVEFVRRQMRDDALTLFRLRNARRFSRHDFQQYLFHRGIFDGVQARDETGQSSMMQAAETAGLA
jgi:hypothetical protein